MTGKLGLLFIFVTVIGIFAGTALVKTETGFISNAKGSVDLKTSCSRDDDCQLGYNLGETISCCAHQCEEINYEDSSWVAISSCNAVTCSRTDCPAAIYEKTQATAKCVFNQCQKIVFN